VAVEKDEDINKIQEIFLHERYSRMPVFDKSIDNIIGIVHEKDFFRLIMGDKVPSSIEILYRKQFIFLKQSLYPKRLGKCRRQNSYGYS
jgi:CBS domain containing-hemolysin-like protein